MAAAVLGLLPGTARSGPIDAAKMTLEQERRVRLMVFPMPQEFRCEGRIFTFSPGALALEAEDDLPSRESAIIQRFRGRWRERYQEELKAARGRPAKLKLVITVGSGADGPRGAGTRARINSHHLSTRPNAEQAYALKTVEAQEGLTISLRANKAPGLYYGLQTFEHLAGALFEEGQIRFPAVDVVDWPEIEYRGCWGGLPSGWGAGTPEEFDHWLGLFAERRLNLLDLPKVRLREADGDLTVRWDFPLSLLETAKQHCIQMSPAIVHLSDYIRRQAVLVKKRFPGAVGQPYRTTTHAICHSHPDTGKLVTFILQEAAKSIPAERFAVWLSEAEAPAGVCHCPECRGDARKFFVNEAKAVVAAIKEVRSGRPDLRFCLLLSQGSYPHNLALLKQVPTDVELAFYHGGMTYQTYIDQLNMRPSVDEMRRLGYRVGVVPILTCSSSYGGIGLFPFQTPRFMKMLMAEAHVRDLSFVMPQIAPHFLIHDFNTQAQAEFCWNSDGRTPEQFALSWATRRRMKEPEKAARVILMCEYAEHALSDTIQAGRVKPCIADPIVRAFLEKRNSFIPVRGFEFQTHEEIRRCLALCQEATTLAQTCGDQRLSLGCQVLRCWLGILERYRYFISHRSAQEAAAQASAELQDEVRRLAAVHKDWLESMIPTDRSPHAMRWELQVSGAFRQIMGEFRRLPGLEHLNDGSAPILLKEKEKAGKLKLVPLLQQKWNCLQVERPPKRAEGPEGRFRLDYDDSNWKTAVIGKAAGSPSDQRYCYRLAVTLSQDWKEFQHVWLVFSRLGSDSVIYVNGEPVKTKAPPTKPGPGLAAGLCRRHDIAPLVRFGQENLIALQVAPRTGDEARCVVAGLVIGNLQPSAATMVEVLTSRE